MDSEAIAIVHKLHEQVHSLLSIISPKSIQPDDFVMPTFRVGDKAWSPSHEDVARWRAAYPCLDVHAHIARASDWYASDGRSFRSVKGARKAVSSWLRSDYERATGTMQTRVENVYREVGLDD